MAHSEEEIKEYITKRVPIDIDAKERTRPLFAPGGFAHASPAPMIAFDRNSNVLWRNKTYADWVVEEDYPMEGQSLYDFVLGLDAIEVAQLLLKVFETGEAIQCVLRLRMVEGNYNHAEWVVNPILDEQGKAVAIVSTGRDVSNQMRVERERIILYNIAEAINRQGSLDDVLLMVRRAIIEIGEFDRAGVWLWDGQGFVGTWGTELNGDLRDEHGFRLVDTIYTHILMENLEAGRDHGVLMLEEYEDHCGRLALDQPMPLAYIGLRVTGQLVGVIFADNVTTRRNIEQQKIESILPLCEQCAIAIQNTSLLAEREKELEQRQFLLNIASQVAICDKTEQALRLVVQAVQRVGAFTVSHAFSVLQHRLMPVSLSASHSFLSQETLQSYLESAKKSVVSEIQEEDSTILILSFKRGTEVLALLRLVSSPEHQYLFLKGIKYLEEFAYHIGNVVHNIYLQEIKQRYVESQLRLTALASAMTNSSDLDALLSMVHETLVTVAGFARAGIWVVDEERELLVERWGTNRDGTHAKREGVGIPIAQLSPKGFLQLFQDQRDFYYYDNYSEVMEVPVGGAMHGVHAYAAVALRAEERLVGIIAVDNLTTDAPITLEDIDALLPFANQAALAIRNARLLQEQETLLSRQRSLATISEAVSSYQDTTMVLGTLWSAIVEWGCFERGSIWRRDGARECFVEVWSADETRQGTPLSEKQFPSEVFQSRVFPQFGEQGESCVWDFELEEPKTLIPGHPFETGLYRVALAVRAEKQLVGVIALGYKESSLLPSSVLIKTLEALVQQVAVTFHQWALREEQQHFLAKEERLLQISKAINDQIPLAEILALVYDALHEVERIDRIGLNYIDTMSQVIQGSWGTDREGKRYLMETKRELYAEAWKHFLETPDQEYAYYPNYTELVGTTPEHHMHGVKEHAVITLRADGELVGFLCVDNLPSGNPLPLSKVVELSAYANLAATAVRDYNLRRAHDLSALLQRYLTDILRSANRGAPLSDVLLKVYHGMLECGGFDRVGIFVLDQRRNLLRGAWGTGNDGSCVDMSDILFRIDSAYRVAMGIDDEHPYTILEDYTQKFSPPPGNVMYGVHYHASILLRVEGETVGIISMDNLFHDYPITTIDIEAVLPLADQVAAIVKNTLLQEESARRREWQDRFEELTSSIHAQTALKEVLYELYRVALEIGGFDRAGVFIVDEENSLVRGAWGTDREGNLVDLQHDITPESEDEGLAQLRETGLPYLLIEDFTAFYNVKPEDEMFGVHALAQIALRTEEGVFGYLCVDNLHSERTITDKELRPLLPFLQQAALVIRNIQLREESERAKERQAYLEEIGASIRANTDLNAIMHQIRDVVIQIGFFDRAGLFLYDATQLRLQGTWGTDREGNVENLSAQVFERKEAHYLRLWEPMEKRLRYQITPNFTETLALEAGHFMYGVTYHACLPMLVGEEAVGLLAVDTLHTKRRITPEHMEVLLPFVGQAALAIRNARLLAQQERYLERQRLLAHLASAISMNTDLNELLRLAREAIVKGADFDRAGIYLVDTLRNTLKGTWGTDREGNEENISALTLDITECKIASRATTTPLGTYELVENYAEIALLDGNETMFEVQDHGAVYLEIEKEFVGILFVDNLLTRRPITHEDMRGLLSFTSQIVVAIRNARMLAERERNLERQRSLSHLASAISVNTNLNELLRLAREVVTKGAGFDRAAIYLTDKEHNCLNGTWGTNREGEEEALFHTTIPIEYALNFYEPNITPYGRYTLVEDYTTYFEVEETNGNYGVKAHGSVYLESEGEFVGILFVDNLLTQRPITDEDMMGLIAFTSQIVVAIRNARMLAERERNLERQRNLSLLATAISVNTDLNEVLRLAREAVVKGAGFDRAGIYLIDDAGEQMVGTWGTTREGEEENISSHLVPLAQAPDPSKLLRTEHGRYLLVEDYTRHYNLAASHSLYGTRDHGTVLLELEGEGVGYLFVDNLLTQRPITHEDMTGLLTFSGQIVVAIRNARLIQKLTQAHNALISTERLRAVGELASGVAHNVNNILAAVLGYAELIQEVSNIPTSALQYAQTIEKAAMDGANIVRRIQHFARKESKETLNTFDLGEVVQEAIVLTRPLWDRTVNAQRGSFDLISQIQEGISIYGVASEIREVVVNLIRNGMDAMPEGGYLTIACYQANGYAHLKVADTGLGMSESVKRRLFEPFFTTKLGLGTGLGLAIAWGIIERHQGRIEVESELGKGSAFTIVLPYALEPALPSQPVLALSQLPNTTVLLVEDEPMVAESLQQGLIKRGATVIHYEHPMNALRYLNDEADNVDVILSDHGLPGMTGLELLGEVKIRYPHIQRILVSGWGANLEDSPEARNAERILTKPVRVEDIVRTITDKKNRHKRRRGGK